MGNKITLRCGTFTFSPTSAHCLNDRHAPSKPSKIAFQILQWVFIIIGATICWNG